MTQEVSMNAKEEITKLIMASYDQGVKDAQQEALVTLEQLTAAVRADEREAAEERVVELFTDMETPYLPDIVRAIRARGEA